MMDEQQMAWFMQHQVSILTRFICSTDPATGVDMVKLFTDDGHGNGNLIFSMPYASLIRATVETEVSS